MADVLDNWDMRPKLACDDCDANAMPRSTKADKPTTEPAQPTALRASTVCAACRAGTADSTATATASAAHQDTSVTTAVAARQATSSTARQATTMTTAVAARQTTASTARQDSTAAAPVILDFGDPGCDLTVTVLSGSQDSDSDWDSAAYTVTYNTGTDEEYHEMQ